MHRAYTGRTPPEDVAGRGAAGAIGSGVGVEGGVIGADLVQRPAQGEDYRRLSPVPPVSPMVPEAAPGALRLPIVQVS